MLFIMVVIVFL